MEEERSYLQKWTFSWDQAAYEFQKSMLDILLGEGGSFIPVSIPRKVFAAVYNQNAGVNKSVVVHLLKATGVDMKAGQTVGKHPPTPAFPELTQDIKFKVKFPGLKSACIASPDFAGRKTLETRQLADDLFKEL